MPGVQVETLGGEVELALCDFPRVDSRSDVLGGHGRENLRVGRPSRVASSCVGRLPDDPTGRVEGSWAVSPDFDARLMRRRV